MKKRILIEAGTWTTYHKIYALKSKSKSGPIENHSPLWKWKENENDSISDSRIVKKRYSPRYLNINNVSPEIHALKSKSESIEKNCRVSFFSWKRSRWKWLWFEDRERRILIEAGTWTTYHKIHALKSKSESGPIENRSPLWKWKENENDSISDSRIVKERYSPKYLNINNVSPDIHAKI